MHMYLHTRTCIFYIYSHLNRLVNPRVVQACTVVLSDWERLPVRTIKSAITLLHRIAFGCKVPIMLFQVWITLFTIYLSPPHPILSSPFTVIFFARSL